MLSNVNKNKIEKLFSSIKTDDEFEVMFNNYKTNNKLAIIDFMNVMKYLKYRSDSDKIPLKESISLDVIYMQKKTYRFSVNGHENINNFLGLVHQRKNNLIFSTLVSQYMDKQGFELIEKTKLHADIIDVDDFDIRFRKTKENVVDSNTISNLKKIPAFDSDNIIFRFKQRLSLQIKKNFTIDLTIVKSGNDINNIKNEIKNYELEIDYQLDKNDKNIFQNILSEVENIKKVLLSSNDIISKLDENDLIREYKNLVYGSNNNNYNNIYSMQPITAEVQHIIDNIPNKYSVSDKADGDKYQMFIFNDKTYLISNNLHVKRINIKVNNLNNTVIEGEYIYCSTSNKYIFIVFDCLFYTGKDIRNTTSLKERLEYVNNVCKKINNDKNSYIIKDYSEKYDYDNIKKHYFQEISNFYESINNGLKKIKENDVLIHPKLFLFPFGGNSSEVFLFADLIWSICTKYNKIECPYNIDGIIFTGINQKYSNNKKEHKLPIYKYKPPDTNSIDVYITFEKNKEQGGYMDIFDNTISIENFTSFRVTNIFVGEQNGGREVPVPFMKELNNHQIYFPLIDGHVRDVNGNLIQNETVIEIIYSNNLNIPHQYRWSILRTRWDKTESVMRYKKKYGNYKDVAISVWNSISQSVTIEEINNLSKSENYDLQIKILQSRLNSKIISTDRQQNIYYQKVSNLAKKLREFHNWIKSIIIYTYCSPTKFEKNGKIVRQSILDIGCGRGGDILKIYHARVGEYVGFDVDYEGIYSSTDGAVSRYNLYKKKFPDFGKVTYLHADGRTKLNTEDQSNSLLNISNDNKNLIEKTFHKDRKFDIITSQFTIHFLFNNKSSIDNLIFNIKTFLKKDGYILLTLFDIDRVNTLFNDNNDKYTSYYTNEDGERTILYQINKKYTKESSEIGNPIDVYMSWINQEGTFVEEYLVPKKLMIDTMKKAGCELVDTDLFSNIYHLNKQYFTNVIQHEENPKNKKFYEKVAGFYGDLKGPDKESKKYSFLSRYYIFRKIE